MTDYTDECPICMGVGLPEENEKLKAEIDRLKKQLTALCSRLEQHENVPNALAETYKEEKK